MEPKWRLQARLESQVKPKWRLEASLEAKLASKWRSEASWRAQEAPSCAWSAAWRVQEALKLHFGVFDFGRIRKIPVRKRMYDYYITILMSTYIRSILD